MICPWFCCRNSGDAGDGCLTVEWIERTEADDDAERLEFGISRKARMSWLNTQEVRGIDLKIGEDLDVVSLDHAQPQRDPLAWAQADKASHSTCSKCGDLGKKQWYTRQYGSELQRWCPGCIRFHRNNMTESAVHRSEEQPVIIRLRSAAENAILRECTV